MKTVGNAREELVIMLFMRAALLEAIPGLDITDSTFHVAITTGKRPARAIGKKWDGKRLSVLVGDFFIFFGDES